ncbi:MAG: tripartite tricarboxylate transporter permease [Candidatus Norongarragalinales archaeon]
MGFLLEEFFLGFFSGFAGLLAFLHANTLLKLSSPFLWPGFSKAVFSSSLSFSKIVFELVPTLFFFAPSISYGVSILPAQKLFFEGKGISALKTTLACFFLAALLCLALAPPFFIALPLLDALVSPFAGWVLLFVLGASFASKQKRWASAFAFALSGVLGMALFSKPFLPDPLFPLLSGLFGIPALLFSLNSPKPAQKEAGVANVDLKIIFWAVVFGGLSSLLPGLSPVVLVSLLFLFLEGAGAMVFVQAVAATLVSKTFFDFLAFVAIGKARSGAVAFASQGLSAGSLPSVLVAGVASLFLAIATMLLLYKRLSSLSLLGGNKVPLVVAVFLAAAVLAFQGFLGLFAMAVAACLGVCAGLLGADKTSLLGCLFVPSLAFYFGFSLA